MSTTTNFTDATLKGTVTGPTFTGSVDGAKFTGSVTTTDTTTPPVEPPPEQGGIMTGDYYVATTGSDSNPGTSDKPFQTIGKAARVVNPGQTVLVKGGTYSPSTIVIDRPGTADKPILFSPYGTEKVIIDGASGDANQALIQLNANFTTFQGFTVQNAKNTAIACWSANGAQVLGNTIVGAHVTGIWCGGPQSGGSRDNIVKGNTITNCVRMNENHSMGSAGGWGGAIGLNWSPGSQAIGNRVYENWGEGILIISATNNKVIGNTVYDNYSVQILPDCAVNCEVSGNFCYWSGNSKWGYLGSGKPDGIRLTRELNTIALSGLNIFNNIVVATLHGISYLGYMAGGGVQNSKVYSNSIINCDIYFDASSATRGNEFKDNIIVGAGPSGSNSGWSCDYNCWDKGQGGSFGGSHDVKTDPQFTGTAGTLDAAAYTLKSSSPCKQKGVNVVAVVAKDYAGVARPSSGAFSIGAYE